LIASLLRYLKAVHGRPIGIAVIALR